MEERLGCDIEHVFMTVVILSPPLLVSPAVPEPWRWLCLAWAAVLGIIAISPYSVLITDEGISVISIRVTVLIKWKDVVRVRYNHRLRLISIRGVRNSAVLPMGCFIHDRSRDDYFMLVEILQARLEPDRIERSKLL